MNNHQSVMFSEAIEGLNIAENGVYIDATFGRGGHTQGILDKLGLDGKVIAFDQDLAAIEYGKKHISDKRLSLIHSAFSDTSNEISSQKLTGKISGILLDLGVSSPQLDDANRGFSFNSDGPLDMRMNQNQGISAADWLATAAEEEIANVIYDFGEEKKSRQIANAIKKYQQNQALTTTLQLANIISKVLSSKNKQHKHPATRSFQAIRIFINRELEQLEQILQQSLQLLATDGRLAVISFHSLEDRIVKRFIRQNSKPPEPLKGLPVMAENIAIMPLKNLGKQFATQAEIRQNKRSRSAILRLAQRNLEVQK
ncbi:MAG: 16S rRNA (cytosine(1402)-N(4))-methyltransferase RsmH [Candidatus Thioglobus sp.]|nr:16S rRNA (cytosine(1402)-N(4))-methyltransferase RsmH [Candidatus Thioglobus sp.]